MKTESGTIRKLAKAAGILVVGTLAGYQTLAIATVTSMPLADVTQIVARSSDQSSIFLSVPFSPNDGCVLNDRGAIVGEDAGSQGLLAAAMLAFSLEKRVEVGIEGCVFLTDSTTYTVPKIVKIKIVR